MVNFDLIQESLLLFKQHLIAPKIFSLFYCMINFIYFLDKEKCLENLRLLDYLRNFLKRFFKCKVICYLFL
jgi:hypothetical protein